MERIVYYVRLDEENCYVTCISKIYDNIPTVYLENLLKVIKRDLKSIINERNKKLYESSNND